MLMLELVIPVTVQVIKLPLVAVSPELVHDKFVLLVNIVMFDEIV